MQFYVTPTCCIARNARCASSSIAGGIAAAFYPDITYDTGSPLVRFLVPTASVPEQKVLVVFRDPVDRFVSACGQTNTDPDMALADLENAQTLLQDEHFQPQYPLTQTGQATTIYKFSSGLQQLCADAGLEWPLPPITHIPRPKPVLSAAQTSRVQALYSQDIAMYGAL